MKRLIIRAWMKVRHEALRYRTKMAKWQYGVTVQKRNPEIMISLTSYPKRFPLIDLCLKSLVNQKMKADRIVLWLGNDTSHDEAEKLRKKFGQYGVEIHRDAEANLRSHKKYYYALRDYPQDVIVLADDDLIYPPDWLESLVKSWREHPNCISARRVHRITWDDQDNPKPYCQWQGEVKSDIPAHDLVSTTGMGVLFPPKCLNKEVLNRNVFMEKALTADDLWLKVMAVISGVKVVWAKNNMMMPTTTNLHQEEELTMINVEKGMNDIVFHDLCLYYHIGKTQFIA